MQSAGSPPPCPTWSGYAAATNLGNPQANSVSSRPGRLDRPGGDRPLERLFGTRASGWASTATNNSTVEQIGIDQHVVNGTPVDNAFWEMWSTNGYSGPGGQVMQHISGFTIQTGRFHREPPSERPGRGSVPQPTSIQGTSTPETNRSASMRETRFSYQSPQAQASTAEWIVEGTPGYNGTYWNPPDFHLVTFNGTVSHHQQMSLGRSTTSSWQSDRDQHGYTKRIPVGYDLGPERFGTRWGSSFYVLANPGASGSASEAASATNVGTATGTGRAVGVNLPSGTRTGTR